MKRMLKWVSATALALGIGVISHAAFVPPSNVESYKGSGAGSNETIYNLDGNGNVVVDGGLTVNGKAISTDGSFVAARSSSSFLGPVGFSSSTYYPSTLVTTSSTSYIIPTATYILLVGTSGPTTIGLPGIGSLYNTGFSTVTAVNGQYVVVGGTSTTNSVTLSSGTVGYPTGASPFYLGAASRILDNDNRIGLIYDSSINAWLELWYQSH